MEADGSHLTHIIKEDANCWFSHVSPDGKWVAYIAYGKDDVAPVIIPRTKISRFISSLPMAASQEPSLSCSEVRAQ